MSLLRAARQCMSLLSLQAYDSQLEDGPGQCSILTQEYRLGQFCRRAKPEGKVSRSKFLDCAEVPNSICKTTPHL